MSTHRTGDDGGSLRRRAERRLRARVAERDAEEVDRARLLHELQVHQIELELQNEELRSARMDTEAALARYTEIFDFAPLAYAALGADGTIREVNFAAARLLGRDRSALVGRRLAQFVKPTDQPVLQATLDAAADDGGNQNAEIELSIDGCSVHVRLTTAVVGRSSPVVLLALEDVTHRKQAEQELLRTVQNLARLNRELEQFAYIASHDLQEPIRNISAFLQRLVMRCGDQLDAQAREYVGFAIQGAKRMSELVSSLLEYSRVQRQEVRRDAVSLDEVVRAALGNLEQSVADRGARVGWDALPVVRGDFTQLVQVLQNLIANGLKFQSAGRAPEIRVEAVARGDDWVVSVDDNGIGVPPDQAERIFQVFQRLHTQEEYPGTGIGLSICRKIVERHGGRVWVEPRAGGGSSFRFTLPVP
ncbi:MAG: PAS domain S-box protein [Acidobacteria bacterium]|nr:PAS domain S-box protein [Acidobacteriota bacterium]